MEELKKKIEQALVGAGNGLKLERIDEEQKILYMEQNGDFEPCVDTALKIINRFPEFAAVVFNFNGYSRTVVTRQTTKQDIGRLFLPCSRLFAENAIAHAYLNRSKYEGYNEILTHVLWNSPEGIEAGKKLDDAVAEANVILEQVKILEQEMDSSKEGSESYLKIKRIKRKAESIISPAEFRYQETIRKIFDGVVEQRKDQILAEAQRILELEEAQRGQGNGTPSDSGQSSESEPGTN